MIYKLIGIAVVKFARIFVRRKATANKTLLIGTGAAAAFTVAAVVGYLLTKETPEA